MIVYFAAVNWELKALRKVQTEQQSCPFGHLTDGELIEVIQKRYDRLPKMRVWLMRSRAKQLVLGKPGAKVGA